MTTDDRAAAVREAAATDGIDLDEAGVGAYAEELANSEALVGDIDPDPPEAEPAADVREGDDPHDAFLYRFETDPADDGPLSGITTAVKDTVAVAAGEVEVALGSDTDGSVRIPASSA